MQMQKAHSLKAAQLFGAGYPIGERLPLINKVARRLSRILIAAAEERGRRRAIQELRRFDNHMLADIGIKRGEIQQAVRKGRREW